MLPPAAQGLSGLQDRSVAGTPGAGPAGPLRAEYGCLDATRARKARHGDTDAPLRVRPEFRPASGGCPPFRSPARHGLPRVVSSSPHSSVPPTLKLRFSKYGVIFRSEVVPGGLCLEPFRGGALGSVLSKSELFMFQCTLTLLDGDLSCFLFFFLTLCRGTFETLVL